MANIKIRVPEQLQRGQTFEVRLLISHPMETGFRQDDVGQAIPQNVINQVSCRYNRTEVFRAEFFPGIAANPYLAFFLVAETSGELEFVWTDDAGVTASEHVPITVAA